MLRISCSIASTKSKLIARSITARTIVSSPSCRAIQRSTASMRCSAPSPTARSLRRLEHAGRSLGGAAAYDAAMHRVTDALAALRAKPACQPMDIVRLTEILAGPEAALRLLDAG
jgi:hypothetical protein